MHFDGAAGSLTLTGKTGAAASSFNKLRIYLHGFEAETFQVNGTEVAVNSENLTLLDPIEEFDPLPQRDKKHLVIQGIRYIETSYTEEEISVSW